MGPIPARRRAAGGVVALIAALLAVVAPLVAAATATSATSAPAPAPPPNPNPANPAVEVYGFSPAATDGDAGPDPDDSYDWSVLTTLAWRSDPAAVAAAHRHKKRIDLDARKSAADVVFNGSLADAARWVGGVVSEVLNKGLDGVNFDLENPIDGRRDPKLAASYTGLVAAAAAAVKAATFGAARVTVDVPYLPYDNDGRDYDFRGLAAAADALFVMAYDTQALMWGRCVAAANSPLPLVERSVQAWLGLGIPPEKLILGLPWYGYSYECIEDDDEDGGGGGGGDARDLCRIAPVPYAGAPCSDAAGSQLAYSQVMELLDPSAPRNVTPVRFDRLSTSLYFNYRDPPGTGPLKQLWFDDPSTLLPKMRVASKNRLRGIGFWNVDLLVYGAGATPLQREQTRAMWGAVAQAVAEWGDQGREEEDLQGKGGETATAVRRRST